MVIADTDVFIAAIRCNSIAEKLLLKYKTQLAVSAITIIELYVGATNAAKKNIVDEIVGQHNVIEVNKSITKTTIRLVKEYNQSARQLQLADAFIAATCIEHQASLLTFNTKDFKFIKGLKLAK